MQFNLEVSFRVGMFARWTVGQPGAQGAGVTGTHGMGVRTPRAADVADATVGLARDVHIPKGMILTMGTLSRMFAAGILLDIVRLAGKTTKVLGANPKLHCRVAPDTTCIDMQLLLLLILPFL